MTLFPPDLKEEELNSRLSELRSLLSEHGGKILHEDHVGIRDFAYRIGKHERGFYIVLYFEYLPEHILELEKTIRIELRVLRHLLLKTPHDYFFKTFAQYGKEAEAASLAEVQEKKSAFAEKKRELKLPARNLEQPQKPERPEISDKPQKLLSDDELQEKLKAEEEKLQNLLENPDIQI